MGGTSPFPQAAPSGLAVALLLERRVVVSVRSM